MDEPVFVCGLGRSGTSWLSRALGPSPELTYIHEAWLVQKLEELADWVGMLHDEWTDFTPWGVGGIDRAAFVESLAGWYRDLLSRAAGGRRFVEKTPHWNAQHLRFLHELFPDAYYVLPYRDGRNCVASVEAKMAADGQPFDFAEECRRWAATMDTFADVSSNGSMRRAMLVRYEDMLDDFDAVFAKLCAFVGIEPFRPSPHRPNSAFAEADGDFNSRWRPWSPEQRQMFKESAGRQLVAWGYVASDDAW